MPLLRELATKRTMRVAGILQYFPLTSWRVVSNVQLEDTMKKTPLLLVGSAFLFLITLPLHAQNGCLNSPENPTAVLAVVGSAGAFFFSRRRK